MKAMDVIEYLLLDYGLSERQVNDLIARFLQEEAADFVEYMENHGVDRMKISKSNYTA